MIDLHRIDALWATWGPWARFALGIAATALATWLAGGAAGFSVRRVGRVLGRRPGRYLIRGVKMAAGAFVAASGVIASLRWLPLGDAALGAIGNVVHTVLVMAVGYAVLRIASEGVDRVVARAAERTERAAELRPLLANLVQIGIVLAVLIGILGVWGVQVGPLLASAGLVGAIVALAAQETLGNIFGGISLILDRSYKVGDFLILPTGQRGRVLEIGIRSTQLVTPDDVLITVPNAIMATSMVINQSTPYPSFRIRLPVSVAYGTDLDHARRVLFRVAVNHPLVPETPSPTVWLVAFGDSAVELQLLFWCPDPALMNSLISDMNFGVYEAFRAEGINIPFPQRVVHIARDDAEVLDEA